MGDMKAGIMVAIMTVVIIMIELILFPIALTFMTNLNSTCQRALNNATGSCSSGGSEWISTSDRSTLTKTPTLLVVIVLFTALGGMIGAIYLGLKG